MRMFLHSLRLLSALLAAVLLAACKPSGPAAPPLQFGEATYDSTALHFALVPNRDCLPLYYAWRTGLFDSPGVKVQIASFASQMDCDTALHSRHTDGGWADTERLRHEAKAWPAFHTLWTDTAPWQLYVGSKLRLKGVKELQGRTLAASRFSASDNVLGEAVEAGGLKRTQVYRPQINDLCLRARMVAGAQVDGAVLTWPYTALATAQGCKLLFTGRQSVQRGAFVVKEKLWSKPEFRAQMALVEKARSMALDSMRLKGPASYSLILQKDYGLPREVADTVRIAHSPAGSRSAAGRL